MSGTVRAVGSVTDCLLSFQADNLPELPPQSITEEAYTDQQGNMVVKKVSRPPEGSREEQRGAEGEEQRGAGLHFLGEPGPQAFCLLPDHPEGDPEICCRRRLAHTGSERGGLPAGVRGHPGRGRRLQGDQEDRSPQ